MGLIECITKETFAPFGIVIEIPQEGEDGFYIVEAEEEAPWRLAVYGFNNRSVSQFECHLYSKESFEPLKGIAVLLVAEYDTPLDFHAFILDKPICLKKGVWHQVLSLSDEAQVKITENLEVTAEYYDLKEPIVVGACAMGQPMEG